MKKVCFFGIYDPNYSRNRVLRVGFETNGYEIIDCQIDSRTSGRISKYWELYQTYKRLDLKHNPCDLVVVAFPGHTVVWLARILFGQKFIFDAFVSLYDSNVMDRKLYFSFDPRAWKDFCLDWWAVSLAPIVLLDTKAQIEYFHKTFSLDQTKAVRVFVGTDDRYFYPAERTNVLSGDKFVVHFHGSFIPLQGIEYIVRSASMLLEDSNIVFRLIGRGQERKKIEALVKDLKVSNTAFIDYVDYDKLRGYLNSAHVCLGIFGITDKASRVIPNKVFEALACGRPIITLDSPAIRELLNDGENVVLCRAGDDQSLKEAILKLKSLDLSKRELIGQNARKLYEEKLTPTKIVEQLLLDIEQALK